MILAIVALIAGLALLVWSADRFVDGAAALARHLGMKPLIIGIIIIGFGTSAPEMLVSALSALEGSPGIALGNAYGSNIANIALILGVSALFSPIMVHSSILKKELPVLTGILVLSFLLIMDHSLSRLDAIIMFVVFGLLMLWNVREAKTHPTDTLTQEIEEEAEQSSLSVKMSLVWLFIGLALLIASSRMLVWGAVFIAHKFGVSDVIIGLTIVAVGTSLPELASSVAAVRRGEHDMALGNVMGSNLFNTLAVVGISGVIKPYSIDAEILTRDMPLMFGLTVLMFLLGFGFRGRPGRINRVEGGLLLLIYTGYLGWLVRAAIGGA